MQIRLFILLFLTGFAAKAGTIVVSGTTLPSFGNCPIYYASESQRYTVSASGLSQALLISAPDHFEVSTNYSTGYSSTIQLNPVSGSINTTSIFIRFSPYTTGAKSGNVVNSSAGSTSMNVAVSATATATTALGTNASTYYNSIGSGSGASLKTALYSKILGHTVTAYGSGSSGLWATYSTTDPTFANKVWDIYSTRLDTVSPYLYTFSTDQCGSYSVEGDCYNREHSFPQSWFASNTPMVSDMFHIYPTDGKVNGMRNNYPHGEVSAATYTSLQGGKLGANTTAGYTGIVFEPINEYKGDLARSFFYMATRYENLIASWQSNGNADDVLAGNSFPVYDTWFLSLLIKWHNQDPPSVKEINRNNAVFGYQLNRNPYIDSPQFVNRIWGGAGALEPNQASTNFVLKSNTTTTAKISWKTGNGQKRLVLARASSPVNAMPADSQMYAANAVFGSGSQIGSGNYVVYNGMGSTIEVSGLNQNLSYYFTVIEYNGTGKSINYYTGTTLASGAINLPVTWLSLEAEWANPNEATLHWSTASEQNNSRFEIERNTTGEKFESIGQLAGKGNSGNISHYYFNDKVFENNSSPISVIEYRVKQIDFDGNYTYSTAVSLRLDEQPLQEIQIINPIDKGISLLVPYPGESVQLSLSDLQGKVVFETKTILQHETFIPMDTELPSGLYFVRLVQRSGQQSFKIIKP